jgi:hypothetical protein
LVCGTVFTEEIKYERTSKWKDYNKTTTCDERLEEKTLDDQHEEEDVQDTKKRKIERFS